MKAMRIQIVTTLDQKKRCAELLVPKLCTYHQLHEYIQIVFNLDQLYGYEFRTSELAIQNNTLKKKNNAYTKKVLFNESIFYYQYGLIHPMHFTIKVLDEQKTKTPTLLSFKGKQMDEFANENKANIEWINRCLMAYDKEYTSQFIETVNEAFKELTSIKHFQDYMHDQIVEIDCPGNKKSYFYATSEDECSLLYFRNLVSLTAYLNRVPNASLATRKKYSDCIEMILFRLDSGDDLSFFMLHSRNYGGFIDHTQGMEDKVVSDSEKTQYEVALSQYVKVIAYAQSQNIKAMPNQMLASDLVLKPFVGQYLAYESKLEDQIATRYLHTLQLDQTLQLDVYSLSELEQYNDVVTTLLILTLNDETVEIRLNNAYLDTIYMMIMKILLEVFEKIGVPSRIEVRDSNFNHMLERLCKQLSIELKMVSTLEKLDVHYARSLETAENTSEEQQMHEMMIELLRSFGLDEETISELRELEGEDEDEIMQKIQKYLTKKDIDTKKLN